MAEIIGAFVGPLIDSVKWTFLKVKREISYLKKHTEIMENLHEQASNLQRKRNDLKSMVDEAEKRGEIIDEQVVEWLKNSEKVLFQVTSLNQEALDDKKCLTGMCLDCSSRRRVSKEAVKKVEVIKELRDEEKSFRRISHNPNPGVTQQQQQRPVQQDPAEEARVLVTNKVMEALKNGLKVGAPP